MMRTDIDALTAVNAQFPQDMRFAVLDPDGSGGTALDTVGTAHTEPAVQFYRVKKDSIFLLSLLPDRWVRAERSYGLWCYAHSGFDLHGIGVFFHIGKSHAGSESKRADLRTGGGIPSCMAFSISGMPGPLSASTMVMSSSDTVTVIMPPSAWMTILISLRTWR